MKIEMEKGKTTKCVK